MPIQFLDDAEPQVRFTDDMEGGTTGHVRFLDEPAPAIAPQVEEQQLKSLTVDQFEALSPHEKARKMSRLEEVQFAPVSILSPKRGESRDVARERQSRALAEEQLKIEQDAAPHNLREHVELARARPSGKAQYWLDRMMFSPTKGAQSLEVLNSAKNISAGVADAKDYEEVSGYLVASERAKEQGIAADVGDLLSAMPAYMAEFAMTGGAYSGTKAAVQRAGLVAVEQAVSKAVARNVGSRLARGAINRAVQAPATAIGIGAQVAANPQQIANNLADHELSGLTFQKGDEGTIETVLKQDDKGFLTNLRNAYVKAGFELGSERAGELLTPLKAAIARRWLGVPGRTPGKLKAALDSAGWHGVIGEMFEERVNELGAPLYGENYQPPTWRQLTTEAIAFSVPGAVNRLTSGKVAEKGTDATTTRTADEVLDGGPTATGVPADGTDRANAPTVVEPRPPDSQRGGAPGAVGAVVPPEVAPGQVASEPPKPQRVDVPGIGAVNIQYPAGSIRSGKDKGGNEWQVTMPAHYGDIVGTKGKDKDRIDIYVGPNAQSPGSVAIVNQINPETGKFDEHKVLAGFTSLPEAVAAYDAAFSDGSGPARRQSVETFSPEQFQTWLKEGDHSKPAGGQKIQLGALPAPVEEPPAPPVTQPAPQGPPPPKKPTTTSAPPTDVALLDMLGAKHDLTAQQAGFVLAAFKTLPANANPEALQKAYLRIALPADIPAEVGLGKVADIKGAKQVLSDLHEASAGAKALPVGGAAKPGPTTRGAPPSAKAGEGARETGTPISPPAATPAGAPPVVDVTANPSATRTPEAAAVEAPKPAKAGLTEAENARLKELQEKLRKKFGATYTGIDPEIITIGGEMASLYIRSGVRKFAAFARDVKNDLPEIWDKLKAHLRSIWEAAAVTNDGLDEPTRSEAKAIVEALDAETVKEPLPKEEGVKTPEVNQPTKKEGEEQTEVGIIQEARRIAQNATDPLRAFRALVKNYGEQPRLGTRTVTSKTNQAYSTPSPLAYLAGQLADLQNGATIAEPTAGNGMLFIGAPKGAGLIANELDSERLDRLKSIFPEARTSSLDASTQEFHDNLAQSKPDREVMNPPFGGVIEEGTTDTRRFPIINASTAKATTPSIDLAIALNTLDALTPDGKAVVLIGAKTGSMGAPFGSPENRAKAYNRPEMLEFFKRFNVVDWFTVGGNLYEKMGAGWPVDVIVIDGKKPTPGSKEGGLVRPWITPPPVFETWESLEPKIYEAQRRAAGTTGPEARPVNRPAEPTGSRARPTGGPGSLARGPRGAGATPAVAHSGRPEGQQKPVPETPRPAVVPAPRAEPTGGSVGVGQPAAVPAEVRPGGEALAERTSVLNVPYRSVSKNADPKLVVPANIADAMRRAVENLEAEVGKTVDNYVAEKMGWNQAELFKHLSSAQIEAVGLFIRNAEVRKTGLINSDQTGVGKGRVVASIIEYARRTGKIPIFITQGKHLYSDMAGRDLPSIGVKDFTPFITDSGYAYQNGNGDEVSESHGAKDRREAMQRFTELGALPADFDGVFTTYYQLQADKPENFKEKPNEKMKRKKKLEARADGPRLAMLRKLAPDAIFILDEAHQAAGLDSDVGLSLQSILKNAAGVFYASATFAKRPDNLTLYSLGTGLKLAGLNPKEMAELFKSGGVPMQQALTTMLAEEGEFVRREQDMSGVKVSFKRVSGSPEQEAEKADTYTSFLRDLHQLSDMVNASAEASADAENQVRPEESQVDLTSVNFGARLFNLSSQYLFSLRAESTAQEAVAALKRGQKPFIAVYNTMAGPISDLVAKQLPLNFGGLLRREMAKMLELKIKDPSAPGDPAQGLKKGERLLILKPEDLEDGGAFYRQVEEQILNTDFGGMPISPIDAIKKGITQAGYKVGEITAREGEVDESGAVAVLSKREKRDRNKVLFDYNSGVLDVVVVNGSGSTGLSAHSDPRFKDQRQRYMIVAQAAPDINVFMQMLGRVMRFGQTSLPEYVILTTNLAAERRFMTMLRGKLTSLNANTSADTESGITQGGLADDIFNQIGDDIVAEVIRANPEAASLARIDLPDTEEEGGGLDNYARYATGRFVLLPNDDAAKLWNDIGELYTSRIRALDEAGENPLKANVQDLRAEVTGTSVIEAAKGKTAFDGPVTLDRVTIQPTKKPYTYQEAMEAAETADKENRKKVNEWRDLQEAAAKERLDTMERREATPEQMDRTRDVLKKVQENVGIASFLLGRVVSVDPTGSGGAAFYAIPIGIELRSKETGDFSSSSKHTLRLATNTLRRTINLPLSQLDALKTVDTDPEEFFENNSESATTRYIAGTNLLRAYSVAGKLSVNITRPSVTMYTMRDGQIRTGVLMGAAFNPTMGAGAARVQVKSADEFVSRVESGTPMTAGSMTIKGTEVRLPSGSATKQLWGDRQFTGFFASDPVERAGEFRGILARDSAPFFFEFVRNKRLLIYETQEQAAEPIQFTDIANKIADSLENLKSGQEPGQLQAFGIIPLVWDQAISIAQGVIRAGGKVADAVAKAIAYIRANHKGDWDEAGARASLETASAEPAATEQGVTEPEGEQPPAVDERWVETKVKGASWWVRDRDRLTPESTERSITVAEAAFTEAGFESERRTMFDQGDHQTKSILFIPETEFADEKGRKLAEVLEREIQTQREEGKGADHVSTLINSVREGFDQPKSAFRQMSAQVRNRLFALAQEEASWRGRALRALANSKADIIRVSRNVDVYLQRIYSKAFSEDPTSETAKELEDALREVLSEEEIQKLKDLVQDPAHRDRIKAALKRALAKVAPKGNRRFGRKNWRTIETLIEGGILDDTEWFKELARKRGWKVPTDAEIEQMRRLADEEQALRQPTDAELAKAGDDPLARERLLADIEAATRESPFRLQKRLAVMWSEMTKPVSMRHYWTQRQNNARFLNELMTANILFRASFVGKQAIDISTQWFWRMPMRAFAQAFNLRRNDLAAGRQTRFWDDSQASLKDIYGDSIKSLKVAASKARAALAGHVEIRNVDRLMGSVSALDRLWLRADRAAEDGRPAEAFMWRAVAAIGFSYKVAGAFDYLHGTPAEWNERRSRVIEALRETGADPAAARVQADWVMNGALAEYPEAVAMTRSMLEARGIPFTEQQLRENAWNMVERRQYQRINELGLPVDAIQEQAEFYRQTLGWNEREMRGLGGVVGGVVSAIGRGFEQVGIPLAMGRFGNAIAIGINRQLHRTPLYKLADLAFMPGSAQQPSAWSRTMTDIYERRLEAIAGTMLGSLVLSAAAFGLWKVWLKPPPDKEERELWEREGHKAGTVEIPLGDGRFSVWSLTTGPFALVAPYLAAGGAINDLTVKREKAQAKLDADAARRGLTPAKLPPPDISDWFGVAAQAAQGSILGQRTASGLFYSVTDYGTPNVKKFVASQFTPLVPGLPALQEVSRMSGVIIDPKKADVLDFLVPLPTSKARKYNMIGDPVGTPDDVQRVIQTLTGGSYPVITPGAAREADAYKALFATGYRPPSIDPNAGRAIGGDFRPFTGSELERYTEARSKNLRQELGRLGPEANLKDAREAYQRANTAALREVGVTVAPRAETSAGGRAGRGTAPPGRTGGVPLATESRSGSVGGAVRRGIRRGRLSRGLRGVRFGRRGLSRASRIRLQPRLGRGRRRGLSRARRVSFARA